MIRIGTAGWAVPRQWKHCFPSETSLLRSYAARFNCAEINSTFYRSHRATTYERWASSVPDEFRFSVKMPKTITHGQRLVDAEGLLDTFLAEIQSLGAKLGPVLVQLPPSFAFEHATVRRFFAALRKRTSADVACEPRHSTWFEDAATALLVKYRIARAAADPAPVLRASEPGAWPGLAYFRWHGSPRMYFSPYEATEIARLTATMVETDARETWCIFDNTGSGAAAGNALALVESLAERA